MIYLSTNVITLKLKVIENEIKKIWIHNIYNFSSTFYFSTNSVNTISMIERCINEIETKHIVLSDFNLHNFLWNKLSKLTQHAITNKLIDVIDEADMKLTFFQETITWKAKNSQSTIDLIFMFNELINKIEHCKARSEINQSFDHISIFTKILLNIVTTSIVFRKLWKSINAKKVKKIKKWIWSIKKSKTKEQINESIKELQKKLIEKIDKTISWTKSSNESKSFWFWNCFEAVLQARKLHRKWTRNHLNEN